MDTTTKSVEPKFKALMNDIYNTLAMQDKLITEIEQKVDGVCMYVNVETESDKGKPEYTSDLFGTLMGALDNANRSASRLESILAHLNTLI